MPYNVGSLLNLQASVMRRSGTKNDWGELPEEWVWVEDTWISKAAGSEEDQRIYGGRVDRPIERIRAYPDADIRTDDRIDVTRDGVTRRYIVKAIRNSCDRDRCLRGAVQEEVDDASA